MSYLIVDFSQFLINERIHFYKFCWRLIQHLVHIPTKLHYKITQNNDSTKDLIPPCTQERCTRRHNSGGKRPHSITMVTYYLLEVYNLMGNTHIVAYHLFLVNMHGAVTVFNDSLQLLYRMADLSFKLGRYTVSSSVRSGEYGWWIALWNTNTSNSNSSGKLRWAFCPGAKLHF